MRRFTVAAVATAVAASLIAPQAILAEQPPPQPAAPGSAATPPPAAGENGDGAPLGSDGPIVTDGSEAQPSTHPTLRTSLAQHAPQTAAASAGPAATVVIKDFLFSPKTVTINVGESVKWDNKGKAEEGHTATGDNFDSGVLKEGESYTHKFSKAGTFDYICTLHSNMKGTVVVRAGSGGGGSGNGGGWGRRSRTAAAHSTAAAPPTRAAQAPVARRAAAARAAASSRTRADPAAAEARCPAPASTWACWRCSGSTCSSPGRWRCCARALPAPADPEPTARWRAASTMGA